MNLTLGEIQAATGGEIVKGDANAGATRLCTDSRTMAAGDVFVALRGPNHDATAFVLNALVAGAAGVVTSRVPCAAEALPGTGFVLRVEDTTRALADIANAWRRKLDATVIAVTGSSGKTTTKELIAHLLRPHAPTHCNEGNKNNHVGLPLTLLGATREHKFVVCEMGMNHAGEIAALARTAMPSIGVLTNIGDAHLGNFESREALACAKGELFESMAPEATAVMNADCAMSQMILARGRVPRNVVQFGEARTAEVRALNIEPIAPFGWRFLLQAPDRMVPATLNLFGRYQVHNALAAATVASLAGVGALEIAERLATFQPPKMRSHLVELDGFTIIEDCYNASPTATVEAIKSFAAMDLKGRRFVLLGDMAELGAFAEESHRRVGRAAAQARLDLIFCVGESAKWTGDEASRNAGRVIRFDRIEAAVDMLHGILEPGDALLVKGSRVARLERAIELLKERRHAGAGKSAEVAAPTTSAVEVVR